MYLVSASIILSIWTQIKCVFVCFHHMPYSLQVIVNIKKFPKKFNQLMYYACKVNHLFSKWINQKHNTWRYSIYIHGTLLFYIFYAIKKQCVMVLWMFRFQALYLKYYLSNLSISDFYFFHDFQNIFLCFANNLWLKKTCKINILLYFLPLCCMSSGYLMRFEENKANTKFLNSVVGFFCYREGITYSNVPYSN